MGIEINTLQSNPAALPDMNACDSCASETPWRSEDFAVSSLHEEAKPSLGICTVGVRDNPYYWLFLNLWWKWTNGLRYDALYDASGFPYMTWYEKIPE